MIRAIPNINTARLTLRAMRPEDFDAYAEVWATPEVVQHLEGVPLPRDTAWEAFLRNAGHWDMVGFGHWAVIEQSTRKLVGQAGFGFGQLGLCEDFDLYPEAGCFLVPRMQGIGVGTEAAAAAHDWFDRVITGTLVTRVAAGNRPARALAERLGYGPLREIEVSGERVCLLRRDGPPRRQG